MPIWCSSELISGRSGSPSRRLSARSKSQPREKSWSNSTAVRLLSDGQACDAEQPYSIAYTQVHVPSLNVERSMNGGFSVSSINGCENSQMPSLSGCQPTSTPLAPPSAGSAVPSEQQMSVRRTSTGTPRRASSGVVGAQTYTMQYIGIANGELGILSQKQKLVPPKPGTSGGVPSITTYGGVHRHASHRPSTASSTPAADRSTSIPAAVTAATAAANATSANTATTSTKSAPQPLSPALSQPATSPQPITAPPQEQQTNKSSALHDANALESSPPADAMDRPSECAAFAPHNDGHATGSSSTGTTDTGSTLASPRLNLSSLVEDARGQVKVITECFYSRALHSHAGPHDRHVRRNKPVGPLVMDMEPLSTALPGRFGRRAPSGGGFPGWKLTSSAPASATGGSSGGDVGGRVTGLGTASPKAPSVESAVGATPVRSRIHSATSVRSGKSARPSSGLASRLPAPERGDRSAGQGRGGAGGMGVFRGATAGPVLQYV